VPRTPDRFPGESDEEGIRLEDVGVDPTVVGEIVFNTSAFKAKDGTGVFDLRSGTGLSAASLVLAVDGSFVYVGDGDIVTK
jgi:hypothetical protein